MARARPNAIAPEPAAARSRGAEAGHHHQESQDPPPAVLTVWRKSLLLSCSGFTVFDASGALAFRVDCYDSDPARRGLLRRLRLGRRRRATAEVVLMDVAGAPLLTVRRQRRSLATLGLAPDRWLIFHGDAAEGGCRRRRQPNNANRPFLSVRRARRALLGGASSGGNGKAAPVAYVTPLRAPGEAADAEAAYVVEGSYGARACAVRDAARGGGGGGAVVAEVQRKERVGDDVFRLVVAGGPRLGAPLAMALVIALDNMFSASAAGGGAGGSGLRRPSLLRRTWSARS